MSWKKPSRAFRPQESGNNFICALLRVQANELQFTTTTENCAETALSSRVFLWKGWWDAKIWRSIGGAYFYGMVTKIPLSYPKTAHELAEQWRGQLLGWASIGQVPYCARRDSILRTSTTQKHLGPDSHTKASPLWVSCPIEQGLKQTGIFSPEQNKKIMRRYRKSHAS